MLKDICERLKNLLKQSVMTWMEVYKKNVKSCVEHS